MKKIFFCLILLSSSVVFGQYNKKDNNNVPSPVRRSFEKDNPAVTNVQWNQQNGQWHANYRDNSNRDVHAYYDRYGKKVDTHIAWNTQDVPPPVNDRITKRYHANGDYKVERIERPMAKPLFQIKIGTRRPIYMDERGREQKYYDHH